MLVKQLPAWLPSNLPAPAPGPQAPRDWGQNYPGSRQVSPSWHLRSPATQLFVEHLVWANYKGNLKILHYWPLWALPRHDIIVALRHIVWNQLTISHITMVRFLANPWKIMNQSRHSFTISLTVLWSCHGLCKILIDWVIVIMKRVKEYWRDLTYELIKCLWNGWQILCVGQTWCSLPFLHRAGPNVCHGICVLASKT